MPNPFTQSNVKQNEPLALYTYFKIGGPADYFFTTTTKDELINVVKEAQHHDIPYLIIGGGSNLLFSDQGFRGLVIRNHTKNIVINSQKHQVVADSGVIVNQLVHKTIENSLEGLEEFLGIPGTVGGAVYNNSHHLKHLMGDTVIEVVSLNKKGQIIKRSQEECQFAYDSSIFHHNNDVILQATYQLKIGNKEELLEKSKKALIRRRDTQPLEFPSSGCMFKNIGEKQAKDHHIKDGITAAGFLIDQAGCKGLQVGGARVSNKHANFIINTGNATAQDVWELSEQVKQKVYQAFGVTLDREVFIMPENLERKQS